MIHEDFADSSNCLLSIQWCHALYILLQHRNLAVLCGADVKVTSSEGWHNFRGARWATGGSRIWCPVLRTPFSWAAMSPWCKLKGLMVWYYHIPLDHINYFIYKSLMKLSLDASHFGKVIRRENQEVLTNFSLLERLRQMKTNVVIKWPQGKS